MSYGMSKYDFKFLRKTNNDFITQSIRVISKFKYFNNFIEVFRF